MTNQLAKRFAAAKKVAPNHSRRAFVAALHRKVMIGTVSESEAFAILG